MTLEDYLQFRRHLESQILPALCQRLDVTQYRPTTNKSYADQAIDLTFYISKKYMENYDKRAVKEAEATK